MTKGNKRINTQDRLDVVQPRRDLLALIIVEDSLWPAFYKPFVIRVRRSIGVEAARGLARLRLANLTHVHTFRRGESACKLRQREKAYYYDAREAHYNRFGPHAWFDPSMRGRTSHHLKIVSYIST